MRTLHKIFAIVVVPALGYLLGATIFNLCWDRVEPGDIAGADYVAVAKSCERHGPIAWRGFGYYYKCRVEVTDTSDGTTHMWTTTGWREPADIGQQIAVTPTRRGLAPEERPYQGLGGVLVMVFGILWIFVLAYVVNPLLQGLPERMRARRLQREKENPPPDEVLVLGARPAWLPVRYQLLVLLACGVAVYASAAGAFRGDTSDTVLAVLGVVVSVLIIGSWVRRLLTLPSVRINPEGLVWGDEKRSWAEIRRVDLSRTNVLTIEPYGAVGPFGDEQALEIHDAMQKYGRVPYTRESSKQLPPRFL